MVILPPPPIKNSYVKEREGVARKGRGLELGDRGVVWVEAVF